MKEKLLSMGENKLKRFNSSLIPNIPYESIIGIRTAPLRSMAKAMLRDGEYKRFLSDLPHTYFEENQIHAFIISEIKSFDVCMEELQKFLPYVDNWATCDQMNPKVFARHKERVYEAVSCWLESSHTYTVRFGIVTLMRHFLDEDFSITSAEKVAELRSGEYYVNMARAWYFAEGLGKRWEVMLPFITDSRLDYWTHNKAITKAIESRKVSNERKEMLKKLKI